MTSRPRSQLDPGLRPAGQTADDGRPAPASAPAIRLVVVAPAVVSGLDRSPVSSDNPAVDPVIAALAQLVRDRYERECAEKAARRGRLRVLEGKSA